MFTPREIRDTEFDRVSRGYNPADVDEFLNQLADQVEKLMTERDEALRQVQPLRNELEQYQSDENAIRSALVSAEKMRESIVNEANQQHDILIRDAEQRSRHMIDDARERVKGEAKLLDEIKLRVSQFKNELLGMYEGHLKMIGSLPDFEMPEYDDNGNAVGDGAAAEPAAPVEDIVESVDEVPAAEPEMQPAAPERPAPEFAPVTEFAPVAEFAPLEQQGDDEGSADGFTIDSGIKFDSVEFDTEDKPYDGFAPRTREASVNEKFGKLDFGDGFSFNK